MVALAAYATQTAPRDGRVYRAYFERAIPRSTMLKAVRWSHERGWVDLSGEAVGHDWRLSAWSPD
jgi:hypothetical protein